MNQLTHWLDTSQVDETIVSNQVLLHYVLQIKKMWSTLKNLFGYNPDHEKVYGSNIGEQRSLRTFRGGRLRAEQGPDGALLPSDNGDESCTGACFKAGDSRVNINKQIW